MNVEEFKNLSTGDLVKHKNRSDSIIISANYSQYVIGVQTHHISNPDEWILLKKANYELTGKKLKSKLSKFEESSHIEEVVEKKEIVSPIIAQEVVPPLKPELGFDADSNSIICPRCKGLGEVGIVSDVIKDPTCPQCRGRGKLIKR